MTQDTVTVTVTAEPGGAHPIPELAMIRLLSMLPPSWEVGTRLLEQGFVLVCRGPGVDQGQVRSRLSSAFADDALAGWQWRADG